MLASPSALFVGLSPFPCSSKYVPSSGDVLNQRAACATRRRARCPSCSAETLSNVEVHADALAATANAQVPLDPDAMRRAVTSLAYRRGAMGRGVRACLRALYRRANFVIEAARTARVPQQHLYVECGPAYVLAAATVSSEKVSRYAVEQRAWPALRHLLRWEEVPMHEARARGARLRGLNEGGRYGRHLFFPRDALNVAIEVAEDIFQDVRDEGREVVGDISQSDAWLGADVEAVVHLRRMPLPGVRTVSARCPRGAAHSNGDRKPSLMLWMNSDGISGGAMCPVCLDDGESRIAAGQKEKAFPRFLTWRVMYTADNRAVLCTPRKRSYFSLEKVFAERDSSVNPQVNSTSDGVPSSSAPCLVEEDIESLPAAISDDFPVGGCVMEDALEASRVGQVQHMAYVTATLKLASEPGAAGDVSFDGARLRTVGTMARQRCPIKVMMWSERRSKGPMAEKRVEEVAWFARQSIEDEPQKFTGDDAKSDEKRDQSDNKVHADEWFPTSIVSISAMRPTGWRDVAVASGRLVSVPAGWEPSAQAWVVFDFDDIENLTEDVVNGASRKIVSAVRREQELSGRCMVVQTGPFGIHVWVELRELRVRPRYWFAQDGTRAWYANLGSRLLAAAHRAGAVNGKVDLASCAAGRFARRPGWRILADGTPFRSRIVTVAASRVRSRTPRIVR